MGLKPYINVNLFTCKDQFCVCNLDEYFLYPVLKQGKDPQRQMRYALTGFLEYQKKQPYRKMREEDEFHYYNGTVYQKWDFTIYDVLWKICVPHSEEMDKETLKKIKEVAQKVEKVLDAIHVPNTFMIEGYFDDDE